MLSRTLAVILLAVLTPTSAYAAPPATGQTAPETAPMSTQELMQASALDQIFTSFGETIATSPEVQGQPVPPGFAAIWKQTAFDVFKADQLHAQVATALEGRFSHSELQVLSGFFRSDFGKRITAIEAGVQQLPVSEQLAARDKGLAILAEQVPGNRRARQIDDIMMLVSADISRAVLGEAMRAMMLSMATSGATGDIEIPWEEIDAQLAQILPSVELEVLTTQRAIIAYAYQALSDDELDIYLDFLATEESQKFYATSSVVVGQVIKEAMSRFGEELASRLNRVDV